MAKIDITDDDVKFIYFMADITTKNYGLQVLSQVNKLLEKLPTLETATPAEKKVE